MQANGMKQIENMAAQKDDYPSLKRPRAASDTGAEL